MLTKAIRLIAYLSITATLLSEPQQPEKNLLKRKSLGGSPSPDKDGHVHAPNKRPKVDDVTGRGSSPAESTEKNGSMADKAGNERQRYTPVKGMDRDDESTSQNARRPSDVASQSPSPRQEKHKLSESRRRSSSTHARSPNQGRRPYESRRRDTSPRRSPDQDRRTYDSRIRDASPQSRERWVSDTSRRGSGPSQAHGDNDRNRRPVVSKEEERKRGKRLFGGLLSTLSQTTSNSQQKRRQEIEKRQQEKAAKQKVEDDLRRNERLAKLDRVRKIEQVRFDEQVVSATLSWR